MKCPTCHKAEMKSRRENWLYDESGLPGITLVGVEVRRCASCGATALALPRVLDLHNAIAAAVIEKPERLTPAEIKYLRLQLLLERQDFADAMSVSPASVSRWEGGQLVMSEMAERLLRSMVAQAEKLPYPLSMLRAAATKPAKAVRLVLGRVRGGRWERDRAAA